MFFSYALVGSNLESTVRQLFETLVSLAFSFWEIYQMKAKIALVTLLVSCSSPAYSLSNTNSPAAGLIKQGAKLDASSKYPQAVECFSKVIEKMPNDPSGYYWRGLSFFHEAKYADAIADLSKVIELSPESLDAHYIRGRAYHDSKQFDKAIQDLDWVIQHDPSLKEAYLLKAQVYKDAKNEEQSRLWKGKALHLKFRRFVAEGEPSSGDYSEYLQELQRRIRENWSPPRRAVSKSAVVLFKVHRDGSISDVKIKESSDDIFFDKNAMEAIRRLKGPSFPPGSDEENDIDFSFDYNNFTGENAQKVLGVPMPIVPTEHRMYEKARELSGQQKYLDAIELYSKALVLYGKRDQDEETQRKISRIQENIGYCYYRLGSDKRDVPLEAIKLIHQSLYYWPDNKDGQSVWIVTMKELGKDPEKFEDLVSYGDELKASGDLRGASVEYQAALKIKNDSSIREKLKGL